MQEISDRPNEQNAPELLPKCRTVDAKFLKLPLAGNKKDKARDKNETRCYEAVDIIENSVPRCPFVCRNDKGVENVDFDHHDGCPATEEVDEHETAFHHRSLLVGRH